MDKKVWKLYPKTIEIELLQPWSTFVMKTKLPIPVLEKMIKISDNLIINVTPEPDQNLAQSFSKFPTSAVVDAQRKRLLTEEKLLPGHGTGLGGSDYNQNRGDELRILASVLEDEDILSYFLDVTQQFVIQQTLQSNPLIREKILDDEWYTKLISMWVVSQKDNEYQPTHIHSECQLSGVMYLKIPEYLPDRLKTDNNDGTITFTSNVAKDSTWGHSNLTLQPAVGDIYIFPSSMYHMVYPFRTADGKGERRSVSFNVIFSSKELQKNAIIANAIGGGQPAGPISNITTGGQHDDAWLKREIRVPSWSNIKHRNKL